MSFAIDNEHSSVSAGQESLHTNVSAGQESPHTNVSAEQESLQQSLSNIDNVLLLPLGKIKKVCKSDPDYFLQSNLASVVGGLATQLFIEKFTEDALLQAHVRDKRPVPSVVSPEENGFAQNKPNNVNVSKTRLTYEDLHQTVSKDDKYMFLKDIIPKQKLLHSLVRENKIRYSVLESGQQMLNFQKMNANEELMDPSRAVLGGAGDVMEGIEEANGQTVQEQAQPLAQPLTQPLAQDQTKDHAGEDVHTDEEDVDGLEDRSGDGQNGSHLVQEIDMDGTTKEDRMIDNENETGGEQVVDGQNSKKGVELIDFGIDSTTDEED